MPRRSRKNRIPTTEEIDESLRNAVLTQADFDRINKSINSELVKARGKVKMTLNESKKNEHVAQIDWLNFTFKTQTITKINPICLSNSDKVIALSRHLERILGFGITSARPAGAFFYQHAFNLGDGYGMVCVGGQEDTFLVSINGTGCSHLKDGWQEKLYYFLMDSVLGSITRIDLAHDDYDPTFYTVDNMVEMYKQGGFQNGGRRPKTSQAGDWLNENDEDGRTFYVGKRKNGLFARIYEKGKQLKCPEHPNWVRCEVEIKGVDRYVPFDVLLKPHVYMAGSYPVFEGLFEKQERIKTKSHEVKADIVHRVMWGKRQSGGLIKLLKELSYSKKAIYDMLAGDDIPKPFKQKFVPTDLEPIHITGDLDHEALNQAKQDQDHKALLADYKAKKMRRQYRINKELLTV